jgi:hypothetical protein
VYWERSGQYSNRYVVADGEKWAVLMKFDRDLQAMLDEPRSSATRR